MAGVEEASFYHPLIWGTLARYRAGSLQLTGLNRSGYCEEGPQTRVQHHCLVMANHSCMLTSPWRLGGHRHRRVPHECASEMGQGEPRGVERALTGSPLWASVLPRVQVTALARLICEPDQLFCPPPQRLTRVTLPEKGHQWGQRGSPGVGRSHKCPFPSASPPRKPDGGREKVSTAGKRGPELAKHEEH